jgi:hypothetical protein
MATAMVLDLVLSSGLVVLVLLGTLIWATSSLDDAVPRGAFATAVVFLTVLLAQYWLAAVDASRLRAAPGGHLTTYYQDGELVAAGADGELFSGPGSVRVRQLAGMALLKRRRRPPVVVPGSLVTELDVEFLTRRLPPGPAAPEARRPGPFRLGAKDHDNLVRTARALYLRGGALGYLVAAVLVVAVRALLHRPGALWWVALFLYLAFVGWLATGRATGTANPVGAELDVAVSDDALVVVDPTSRRVVRFADVRALDIRHDVLVLRRRGVPAVLLPLGALPEDAFARMRSAFSALQS